MTKKRSVEKTVRDISRHTRKKYSSEEKIRIVLDGLRGEEIFDEREMIKQNTMALRKQTHYDKKTKQLTQ